MQVMAVANQKGGVGKTTSVVCLAAALAEQGERVLCVDLDPQAALTASTLGESLNSRATVYDALWTPSKLKQAIASSEEGFDVAISAPDLAGAEVELAGADAPHARLATALKPLAKSYAWVLIDCPPSLGLLTVNALTAARWVLVPVAAEFLALRGLAHLMDTIGRVQGSLNPSLELLGLFPTLYDGRTLHAHEVRDALEERFADALLPFVIRRTVRFREAPIVQQSILAYAPRSDGAKAYRELSKEVIRRVQARNDER